MKASDLVRPEACQHVVPDQRSVLNPPKDPRGTRGSRGKSGLRNSTASCQRLPFPDDFSHSGKAWLGGASPWECPATPRSWKRPFQVPCPPSSFSATQQGHLLSAGVDSPWVPHPPRRLPGALPTASAPPALSPAGRRRGGPPDNCQPEVWTPSPWWLPLFH